MFATDALPFRERPLLELLEPDAADGWARAERVWLATTDGSVQCVDNTLVLALHAADGAEAMRNDIDLELAVPDHAPITAPVSLFLAVWLPKLPEDVASVVLALRNPHRAHLFPPAVAPGPLWYAHGAVTSRIDRATREVHLVGERWQSIAP